MNKNFPWIINKVFFDVTISDYRQNYGDYMAYYIHKTELEDFVKSCNKKGFDEYDFTINGYEIEEIMKIELSGRIKISRKGVSRQYDPSRWAADCISDIEAGIFD